MAEEAAPVSTRRLLALTASAFFVLAAEPTYLLIDTAVVGHLGPIPLAALGIGATLMSLLLIVGSFVEYGTTSRSARAFGAGRTTDAVNEGVQASWLALVIGLLIVVAGEIFAGPATRLLTGGPSLIQHDAESWFRIAVLGMPLILLVLAGNGWMRGVQRTRAPVLIVVLANLVSAALSPLLVYTAGLGLNGSACANVIGQVIGATLFVLVLHKSAGRQVRAKLATMRAQLVMGRDLIVRSAAFQAAFLVAAAAAARMGTAQIAAHSVGMQIWEFTALLLDSFAIAAQSLVGAALGGGDGATARHTAWQVARLGGWAGLVFAVIFGAGWSVIPEIFTSSVAVQHQLHVLWPWFIAMLPIAGVVFALDGVLIGAGDVGYMRTLTIVAALGFIPICLAALHWNWGIGGIWAGLLVFVFIRLVGMLSRTRTDRWIVLGAPT